MPPALSSPGFLIALGVLLSNDLWWKAAYHSWLTGKLSDVAGLFVVVVLAAAFRPASGRLIAAGAAITFTLWKSPLSQPLIDAWNASAPYRIARVALLAILGTSRAQPTTFPYEAVEGFTLAALPVYDVALAPATIVERLRQANFTVQGPVATDVEILSGVTCQTGVGDGRSVVHALLTIQPSGDVSRLLVQRLELCRRRPPWDSASAAAAFESEVLARIGGGTRRP